MEFELSGGRLCLDLANTLADRPTAQRELLTDFGALLVWGRQAGVLELAAADAMEREARRRPGAAGAAVARARQLRELIFDVFHTAVAGAEPSRDALAGLSAWLPRIARYRELAASGPRVVVGWRSGPADFDRIAAEAADSAIALLASPELDRVRECESATCAWLFLDASRNRSRRWCDMRVCGNRVKARRFYARRRENASA